MSPQIPVRPLPIRIPNHNQTVVYPPFDSSSLLATNHNQTIVRLGRVTANHNQTVVRQPTVWPQHNQTLVRG